MSVKFERFIHIYTSGSLFIADSGNKQQQKDSKNRLKKGGTGNAILKNDHSIKESKLFIDNISISSYNNAMSQLYNHKFTAKKKYSQQS